VVALYAGTPAQLAAWANVVAVINRMPIMLGDHRDNRRCLSS
jgi:hypothetical protein